MSSIAALRKFSSDPLSARFKALTDQLAQSIAQNTQIETTDMPNSIKVDNSIISYSETSQVLIKPISLNYYLPFEPDLNTLTLWYRFDDWTNTVSDASFFQNDGVIQGGVPLGTNGPDKGFGQTIAFGFNGSGQQIDVFDDPSLRPIHTTGSFTNTGGTNTTGSFKTLSFSIGLTAIGFSVAALIYPTTFSPNISGQYRYIVSKVDDFNNMWLILLDTLGLIHFWVYKAGVSHSVVSITPITALTWNWITVTFSQSTNTSTIYLNGALMPTATDTPFELAGPGGGFAHASTDMFIGSNSGLDGFFQGYMSDFRYYHEKVLNQFEVSNLATNYYTISAIPFGQVLIISLGAINPTGALHNNVIIQLSETKSISEALSVKKNGAAVTTYFSLIFVTASSQYVDCTNNSLLAVGETAASQASYACWFKVTSNPPTSIGLMSKGIDGMEPYISSSGTLNCDFIFNTHASDFSLSGVSVADGSWHHMVCSNNATGHSQVYVDGVLKVDDANGDYLATTGTTDFKIGSVYGVDFFGGKIADPKVYNVQLTQAEVTTLFNGTNVTRGLVASWAMTEGSGTTITDSVNGIIGTLTNNPTWSSDVSRSS